MFFGQIWLCSRKKSKSTLELHTCDQCFKDLPHHPYGIPCIIIYIVIFYRWEVVAQFINQHTKSPEIVRAAKETLGKAKQMQQGMCQLFVYIFFSQFTQFFFV